MIIPINDNVLKNANYVVLTVLIDRKWYKYNIDNVNYIILKRDDYLKYKDKMVDCIGLSKKQWDRHFKKLKEVGVVEEIRNKDNKLCQYKIYHKNKYVIIEDEIIRELRKYKSTSIKAYAYLKYKCKNGIKRITLEDMCNDLGLSKYTRENLFDLLKILHNDDYINIYNRTFYYEYSIVSSKNSNKNCDIAIKRNQDAIYYIVYEITDKTNGMKYIGKHKTTNINDGYMGSGRLLKQNQEIKGIENFTKKILHLCKDEQHMAEMEAMEIEKVKAYENNMYYNLKKEK